MYRAQIGCNAGMFGAHQLSESLTGLGRMNKYTACDGNSNLRKLRAEFAYDNTRELRQLVPCGNQDLAS